MTTISTRKPEISCIRALNRDEIYSLDKWLLLLCAHRGVGKETRALRRPYVAGWEFMAGIISNEFGSSPKSNLAQGAMLTNSVKDQSLHIGMVGKFREWCADSKVVLAI
ncbi:hypothetical protein TNCV_3803431 [Trichonephila clavipes]|nr:hypothetical protein TNCV_3803431 [Trichonephila clavipes]